MHSPINTVQILVALSATACLAMPDGKRKDISCMDTPRHKAIASPEEQLYKTCSPYEGLSCCNNATAAQIHGDNLYKFQNVVCKNKELSPECKKYLLKDACFYECSPDIAAYAVKEDNLENVPLCETNCDNWFAACSNDFTCTKNWKKAMSSDTSCSANDKCQTIKDKFQNAKDFCEKVWGNSYKVVADDEQCLRFDEPARRNPVASDQALDEKHEENDCDKDGDSKPNSSSSIKYNIILAGVSPFMLCYMIGRMGV